MREDKISTRVSASLSHRIVSNSHGAHCGTECSWNVSPYFIPSRTTLPASYSRGYPDLLRRYGVSLELCSRSSSGTSGLWITAKVETRLRYTQISLKIASSGVSSRNG